MSFYSLHYINPRTDHVDRVRSIDAGDDVEAARIARRCEHRPLELWCESRRIQRLAGVEEEAAENRPEPV